MIQSTFIKKKFNCLKNKKKSLHLFSTRLAANREDFCENFTVVGDKAHSILISTHGVKTRREGERICGAHTGRNAFRPTAPPENADAVSECRSNTTCRADRPNALFSFFFLALLCSSKRYILFSRSKERNYAIVLSIYTTSVPSWREIIPRFVIAPRVAETDKQPFRKIRFAMPIETRFATYYTGDSEVFQNHRHRLTTVN